MTEEQLEEFNKNKVMIGMLKVWYGILGSLKGY